MADPISISVALGALGQAVATEIAWTVAAEYAISTFAFDMIVYGVSAAVSVIGSSLLAPGLSDVEGPRANENQQQFSTYGKFIQIPYGRIKTGGNIFWTSGLREVATSQEVGGKGGGGGQTVTTYTYYSSWALGLCEGKVQKIHKIWFDSDLVYNDTAIITLTYNVSLLSSGTVTTSTQVASFSSDRPVDITATIINDTNGYYVLGTGADSNKIFFTQAGADRFNVLSEGLDPMQEFYADFFGITMPNLSVRFQYDGNDKVLTVGISFSAVLSTSAPRTASTAVSPIAGFTNKVTFYYGTEDQTADPTMEAVKGTGNVPAYRGICYILFNDFELGDWGNRIPNISVELSRFPDVGETSNIYPIDIAEDGLTSDTYFISGILTVIKFPVDSMFADISVRSG